MLVEAFSREYGRIGAIAKGARSSRSRWRGLLEPLSSVALSWAGRGELYTLTGVDLLCGHALSGNRLMGGLYAAELIMRLTARDDSHPRVYDSLSALLSAMGEGAPAIIALRFFERDLLEESGYGLNLNETVENEPIEAGANYAYHPEHGLRHATVRMMDNEVAVAGRTLFGLLDGSFPDRDSVRQARTLMQTALAPHIGSRPLKSVQTLQAMQQFVGGYRQNEDSTGDLS